MTDDQSSSRNQKHHPFLILVVGIVLGVVLAYVLPRYAGPYLPGFVSPATALEGEVSDKLLESGRLVLKVSTEDGVLLASFKEMRSDVDLLVEKGDSIALKADHYRPFLTDPTVVSVRKSGHAPMTSTTPSGENRERQDFQTRMEDQLVAWEAEIEHLEASAAELGEEVGKEHREQLAELHDKRDAARQRLDELKGASGAAWEDVKAGVERSWAELRRALDQATSRFDEPSDAPASGEDTGSIPEPPN